MATKSGLVGFCLQILAIYEIGSNIEMDTENRMAVPYFCPNPLLRRAAGALVRPAGVLFDSFTEPWPVFALAW